MANNSRDVFEKVKGSSAGFSGTLKIAHHRSVGKESIASSPGRMWISGLIPVPNKDHGATLWLRAFHAQYGLDAKDPAEYEIRPEIKGRIGSLS